MWLQSNVFSVELHAEDKTRKARRTSSRRRNIDVGDLGAGPDSLFAERLRGKPCLAALAAHIPEGETSETDEGYETDDNTRDCTRGGYGRLGSIIFATGTPISPSF